jgi:hypothetical protein
MERRVVSPAIKIADIGGDGEGGAGVGLDGHEGARAIVHEDGRIVGEAVGDSDIGVAVAIEIGGVELPDLPAAGPLRAGREGPIAVAAEDADGVAEA